jgi:large subunit ribosomal protein L24
MKIRSWDTVIVITWKDKWKKGEVLKVFREKNKVIVKWINVVTRHVKKQGTNPGQIVKFEKAIDASNIMFFCPFTEKRTRLWFVEFTEKWKKKKFRYSKRAVKELGKKPKEVIIK